MPSNYPDIYFNYESAPGVITPLPAGVTVKARVAGSSSDISESPFTTDSEGKVAANSIAGEGPATVILFRVENYNGMATSTAVLTT